MTHRPPSGASRQRRRRARPTPRRTSSSRRKIASPVGSRQRIVGERRQPVLAAVARPGERRPGAADDRAEVGIGQHVRPRQRRLAIAVEHDDVFAAVGREPAEPVLHHERAAPAPASAPAPARAVPRRAAPDLRRRQPGRGALQLRGRARRGRLAAPRGRRPPADGDRRPACPRPAAGTCRRACPTSRPRAFLHQLRQQAAASRRGSRSGARSG